MALVFSDKPGCQESHVRRRSVNKLIDCGPVTQADVDRAREADQQEAEAFRERLMELMNQAVNLESTADSDIVLKLKEDLDELYEQCAGLAGETAPYKEAIAKLVGVVMQAVRAGAGNDMKALSELEQEDTARAAHYAMLDTALVAHLLRPDSPIQAGELVPILLGEEVEVAEQVLSMFDAEHLVDMAGQAESLLASSDGAVEGAPYAGAILGLMREYVVRVTRH